MPRGSGGGGGEEDSGGGDKPQTPASEPAQSQPASPQKKKKKTARSHSIPHTPNAVASDYGSLFGHRGNGIVPGHPVPYEGDPHIHPQWPHPHGPPHPHMHQHPVHSPMSSNPAHMQQHMPMSPGLPPGAGYPGHPGHPGHPSYMRPPMSHPQHMPPTSIPMQGMGMPPSAPGEPVPSNGPTPINHNGIPPTSCAYNPVSSGQVYPKTQSLIVNPNNPSAPPIYPCGNCHKEVHDSEQAILCESGCNFWFHRQCTGLTQNAYSFLTKEIYAEWICDSCVNKKTTPLIKLKP